MKQPKSASQVAFEKWFKLTYPKASLRRYKGSYFYSPAALLWPCWEAATNRINDLPFPASI